MKILYLCCLLFLSFRCSEESKESPQKIPARYSNDTLKMKVIFSIRGDAENSKYTLFSASDFYVDNDNYLYLVDPSDCCVKIFDKDGIYIKKFGREGHGPGEFLVPHQIEPGPNGSIIIYDSWIFKFNYFSRNGDFFWSRNFNRPVRKFRRTSKDNYILETEFNGSSEEITLKTDFHLTVYDSRWEKKGLIFSEKLQNGISIRKGNKRWGFPLPFPPELQWDLTPKGNVIIGVTNEKIIRIKSPEGKIVMYFDHNIKQEKIKEKDRQKFWEVWKGVKWPEYIKNSIKFPDYKPFYKKLFVDESGYIILQQFDYDHQNIKLYIYSPEGKLLNELKTEHSEILYNCIFKDGFVYNDDGRGNYPPVVTKYKWVQ